MSGSSILPLALAVCLSGAVCLPSLAGDFQKEFRPSPATFHITVRKDNFSPDIFVTEGYRLPAKVDGQLVQQIYNARMELPCWHGMHGLAPGAASPR